jgi:uncharacterized protein (DUF1778 family)
MPRLILRVSADELDWVKHAASLKSQTLAEYVKRAINASLRREGVDAVLFRQSDDEADPPVSASPEEP